MSLDAAFLILHTTKWTIYRKINRDKFNYLWLSVFIKKKTKKNANLCRAWIGQVNNKRNLFDNIRISLLWISLRNLANQIESHCILFKQCVLFFTVCILDYLLFGVNGTSKFKLNSIYQESYCYCNTRRQYLILYVFLISYSPSIRSVNSIGTGLVTRSIACIFFMKFNKIHESNKAFFVQTEPSAIFHRSLPRGRSLEKALA